MRRGIRVSTNTNMTLMTEERAAECVASGLSTLHASLDGAHAASYEAIRLRASFDEVMRNLRRLMVARRAAGSALPQVKLVAVVMRMNLDELPALVQLAGDEGVESPSVQHLCHDFGENSLPAQYQPMRAFIHGQTLLRDERTRVDGRSGTMPLITAFGRRCPRMCRRRYAAVARSAAGRFERGCQPAARERARGWLGPGPDQASGKSVVLAQKINYIIMPGSQVQRALAEPIFQGRVGASLQQHLHHADIALAGPSHQRRFALVILVVDH